MGEYKINNAKTAAVSQVFYYNEDMATCPRGAKCILLSRYGVAVITEYQGDKFWVGWAALPKRQPQQTSA